MEGRPSEGRDRGRDGGGGGEGEQGRVTVSEQPVKVKPKNIRDKTNKYCDVCDVTLDTRILFLSHCSNVHDVKFKGKSGQPLVIPKDADSSRISLGQGESEAGASPSAPATRPPRRCASLGAAAQARVSQPPRASAAPRAA